MKKMVALLSLIFLLIILSACGGTSTTTQPPNGDPANDDAARIISSVVDAFIGQVNLELKAEGITEGVLATGTVDANGNISVELPETVPSTFLEAFEAADGCNFSPATSAQSFSFEQLNVYANNQLVGTLTQGNATTVLARVFVTEDASIVCTDASQNAEFKRGWNLVSFDLLTEKGQVIPSSSLAWAFAGNLPEPTDPNPTDPNPTDPNPTDPNPTDPNPDKYPTKISLN